MSEAESDTLKTVEDKDTSEKTLNDSQRRIIGGQIAYALNNGGDLEVFPGPWYGESLVDYLARKQAERDKV